MKSRLIFLSIVAVVIGIFLAPWQWRTSSNNAYAADPTTAVAATAKLVPGLMLSFLNTKSETVDAREARLVALMVPAGSPPSAGLDAGPFTAVWTGILNTKIKDTYQFAAEGRGEISVTLNEKPVLQLKGDFADHPTDAIPLRKGKNRLVVTYHAPTDGDATVRLMWAASGRPMEPISPAVFLHDAGDDLFAKHQAIRTGRELVGSMRCNACHPGVDGAMPELKQDAPSLADIKLRLNPDWVAYWISNPRALRPTATMPRVFHDAPASDQPSVDPRANDIAAYLCELPSPPSPPRPAITDPAVLAKGARLFTGLGCVACHVAPGLEDSDPTLNRVPLKYVKDKFADTHLQQFLLQPQAHYAWIRMPNFHLSDSEATALSAWLISRCKDRELPPITQKFDAANGKKLFESAGCTSCHATGSSQPHPPTGELAYTFENPFAGKNEPAPAGPLVVADLTKANFNKGCLADDTTKLPIGMDFGFTADQRSAIRAFAATDWKPALQRDPLPEFASRQISGLRCIACHSMDGKDNLWSTADADISAIEQNLPDRPADDPAPKGDQSRPPLTWTGEKLQPSWMTAFISGQIPYKPRPWLNARMPAFASRAELLSKGMALSHGFAATDEVRPPIDENQADTGKQLTARVAPGLGCVNCHSVADQAAIAPFEADAPNFAHVEARLRHSYFSHWMNNPQYYLPGTKMPTFTQADGKTANRDVLDGDAAAIYETIWNYLRAGEKIVPTQ